MGFVYMSGSQGFMIDNDDFGFLWILSTRFWWDEYEISYESIIWEDYCKLHLFIALLRNS